MSCWVCERANGTCEHTGGSHLDERTAQLVAAITRAETAERDLAALRRRVEEACREDTNHVAWVRARVATMPAHSTWAGFAPVLEALDHARAAAGELRAALQPFADAATLTHVEAEPDVGVEEFWMCGGCGAAYGKAGVCDESDCMWASAYRALANRPDVLAAIKKESA